MRCLKCLKNNIPKLHYCTGCGSPLLEDIKAECVDCEYYWQNDDTGMYECQGQEEICHEFIKVKEK